MVIEYILALAKALRFNVGGLITPFIDIAGRDITRFNIGGQDITRFNIGGQDITRFNIGGQDITKYGHQILHNSIVSGLSGLGVGVNTSTPGFEILPFLFALVLAGGIVSYFKRRRNK